MRYVNIGLIVVISVAVLLLTIQNLTGVTVSFLGMSASMPLSVLMILIYFLGMVSGSALTGGVGKLIRGARRPVA